MSPHRADAGIEAFGAAAAAYEAWFTSPLGSFVDQEEKQALARLLQGVDRGSVLDIGAGTGHITTWLTRRGYYMTALEPCQAMREVGKRQTEAWSIHWCDALAEQLPFRDASFDGALLFTSLEFVQDPARVLCEAMRVVRRQGWVIVGFLHALSPWAALYRYRANRGEMPWATAQFFTRDDVERDMGRPADQSETAVYLAPQAMAPLMEAERSGRRAGNRPAVEILRWRKR
jgi:ubiquinone/menaquinone biosynthesis C-methylase UbiE